MLNRAELAAFLRTRRERLRPHDVGLPDGQRRRTPGLRRQEVAQLASLSVDYYIRLEQARGPRPSRHVLAALARALMLSADEREYLFRVAGEEPFIERGGHHLPVEISGGRKSQRIEKRRSEIHQAGAGERQTQCAADGVRHPVVVEEQQRVPGIEQHCPQPGALVDGHSVSGSGAAQPGRPPRPAPRARRRR